MGTNQVRNQIKSSKFFALGKDIIVYGVMAGASQLTGFILLPLFTYSFTADEYGLIDIITIGANLLTDIIRLALPTALRRYFFTFDTLNERKKAISMLIAFMGIFGTILILLVSIFSESISSLLTESPEYALLVNLGLLSALFSALVSIPQTVLQLERKIVLFNVLNIIYSILYALFAIYFIYSASIGIVGVLAASMVASLAQFILAIYFIRNYLTRHFSFDGIKQFLKYSIPLLPSVVVTWINKQADRLVLLRYLGLGAAGIFGAASRIGLMVQLPVSMFRKAWDPYAMSMIVEVDVKERDVFFRRVMNYYLAGFLLLGLGLTTFSSEIFDLLVSEEFRQGYIIIPWVVGASILHGSGNISNIGILISKKTYAHSLAAWSGALMNILLVLVLIPLLGIGGAALGAFFAEMIYTGILCYYSRRFSNINFNFKAIANTLIIYIIASGLLLFISENLQVLWLSLIVKIIIFVISVLILVNRAIDKSERQLIWKYTRLLYGEIKKPK